MAGNVKLAFTISKDAAKLIRSGKAVLESGGVRSLNGNFIELARPAVDSVVGNLSSPITMISSLGNNVQSGFIQHGVNKANAKLDVSLEKLDQIQTAINGLSHTNALGWVNCAFGMVNCGISLAGFYMALQKIEGVSDQISKLTGMVERKIVNDHLEIFERYCSYIRSDIAVLMEESISELESTNIPDHIEDISAFLKRVIREFENKEIDGVLGCQLIFSLSIAFAQEIKAYSSRYYYQKGKLPANYEHWISVLDSINSDVFKEYLKQFLIFDWQEISTQERYTIYSAIIFGVQEQLGNLEYTKETVLRISEENYMHMDGFLLDKLNTNQFYEKDGKVCIPV